MFAHRKLLAARLLSAPDNEVGLPHTDIGLKAREIFRDDLQQTARDGTVSKRLYGWVLILRSLLPHDTQDIEGANSILVAMSKAAPQLQIGLASARMSVKLGTCIGLHECCELHDAVMEHMGTQGYDNRFAVAMPELPEPLGGAQARSRCRCKMRRQPPQRRCQPQGRPPWRQPDRRQALLAQGL